MKLKIKSVEKLYDPFTMNNGGIIYSKGVKLDNDEWVKVRTFKKELIDHVEPGFEFIANENCGKIEKKAVTKKDTGEHWFNEYTIYAKEKEYQKGNGFKKISMEEFEYAIEWCKGKSNDGWLELLDIMVDHVEIKTGADKVQEKFNGEQVPF